MYIGVRQAVSKSLAHNPASDCTITRGHKRADICDHGYNILKLGHTVERLNTKGGGGVLLLFMCVNCRAYLKYDCYVTSTHRRMVTVLDIFTTLVTV